MPDIDVDTTLDSTGVEVLEGAGVDEDTIDMMLDDVPAMLVIVLAAIDDTVLLIELLEVVAVIPVVLDEATAIVPVMVEAINEIVLLLKSGAGVVVLVKLVVLDDANVAATVDDELFSDATAVVLLLTDRLLLVAAGIGIEVLECTGIEVLAIPAMLDDANPVVLSPAVLVCAAVLVMTAVGDEGVLALEEAGEGVVVVLPAPVLLLKAARTGVKVLDGANVELLVISVMFVNGVFSKKTAVDDAYVLLSRAFGAGVVVFVAPTLLDEANTAVLTVTDVDDMLIFEVLEGSIEVVATVELLDDANVAVLIVEDDEALLLTPNGVGVGVLVGIGMDVVMPSEVLGDVTFAMPELLDTPLQLLASGLAGNEDVPSGHARQFADPDVFLKLPASHAVHKPPSTPVKPALHKQSLESALAEGEVELAGQSKQLPPSDVSL